MQFLVDPRQQPNGGVDHAVPDSLWFRGMLDHVPVANLVVPFRSRQTCLLRVRERRDGRFCGDGGELGHSGFLGEREVRVHCDAGLWVFRHQHACDERTEVAALADVLLVAKGLHKLVAVLGMLVDGETFLRAAGAKAIIDETLVGVWS